MGRQIVFYSVLWVSNNQTLRTTDVEECLSNKSWSQNDPQMLDNSLVTFPQDLILTHLRKDSADVISIFSVKNMYLSFSLTGYLPSWVYFTFVSFYNSMIQYNRIMLLSWNTELKLQAIFEVAVTRQHSLPKSIQLNMYLN